MYKRQISWQFRFAKILVSYQEEGKDPISLEPGMVVTIPANVKHWHGAKKNSWFSHIAIEVPGENSENEWCEAVTDEKYNKLS